MTYTDIKNYFHSISNIGDNRIANIYFEIFTYTNKDGFILNVSNEDDILLSFILTDVLTIKDEHGKVLMEITNDDVANTLYYGRVDVNLRNLMEDIKLCVDTGYKSKLSNTQ